MAPPAPRAGPARCRWRRSACRSGRGSPPRSARCTARCPPEASPRPLPGRGRRSPPGPNRQRRRSAGRGGGDGRSAPVLSQCTPPPTSSREHANGHSRTLTVTGRRPRAVAGETAAGADRRRAGGHEQPDVRIHRRVVAGLPGQDNGERPRRLVVRDTGRAVQAGPDPRAAGLSDDDERVRRAARAADLGVVSGDDRAAALRAAASAPGRVGPFRWSHGPAQNQRQTPGPGAARPRLGRARQARSSCSRALRFLG